MIFEVYDAFLSMGATEEKARKAAEAISNESLATKGDIVKLDNKIEQLNGKVEKAIWMIGVVILLVVANFAKKYL